MIAASLNWRYASARSASAFASASPLVNTMPGLGVALELRLLRLRLGVDRMTRALASPFVTVIAASAWPASFTRSASAWAAAIRASFSPSARLTWASASASAGRTVDVRSSFCVRAAASWASSVCLRVTSWVRLRLGERPGLGGPRLGGRDLGLGLGLPQRDVALRR